MIPRNEHPNPNFKRNDYIILNGQWDFEFDFSNSGKDRKLFDAEIKELLDSIFALPEINTCPHGRPIICQFSKKGLEKEFYDSLARDAKILKSLGFEIEFAQGADMFPHSYHIETIAKFSRQ